jgi:hypothetical protein
MQRYIPRRQISGKLEFDPHLISFRPIPGARQDFIFTDPTDMHAGIATHHFLDIAHSYPTQDDHLAGTRLRAGWLYAEQNG